MPPPFRLIDLFSGCGGLTQGFVETNLFEPVAAVELDASAAATYALNFGHHVHVGDIRDWALGPLPHADVVVGGPPCQGFSSLGKQDPDDPRSALWDQYVEVIRRVKPTFFVIENVRQFLTSVQYGQLQSETSPGGRLSAWEIEPHLLNAADYGVAQARKRAVVIGRQAGTRPIGPPTPLLRRKVLGDDDVLGLVPPDVDVVDLPDSKVTINGVVHPGPYKMADLHFTRRPTPLSMARYRAIPAGGNRRDLPDELLSDCWRRHTKGSGDVMGRLDLSKPSVTIRTEFFKPEKGRYLHPFGNRPITHYEAALIQGFPDDFLWAGNKVSLARQIGNAVPPPLARAVADRLVSRLPK